MVFYKNYILPENYNHWTVGAIECYKRNCNCNGCSTKEFFSGPCCMHHAVSVLLKEKGLPPEDKWSNFIEDCMVRLKEGESSASIAADWGISREVLTWRLNNKGIKIKNYKKK